MIMNASEEKKTFINTLVLSQAVLAAKMTLPNAGTDSPSPQQ